MPRPTTTTLGTAAVVLFIAVMGCSDDSVPRSNVALESVNENQVLTSDVYNNGEDKLFGTDDDFIVEDQVPFVVRNRPHDPALNVRPNGPFGAVVLSRYQISFSGEETLPSLAGGMHLRVVSGSTATGELPLIPAAYKTAPPLAPLLMGGEMRFTATIRLTGVEEDSGHEVSLVTTLPVHVANWGDE